MSKRVVFVPGLCLSLVLAACGGGGGGGSSPVPPPCAAATRTCYVSVNGSDTNSGADPSNALATINRAVQIAQDGYRIIVGPGTYRESVSTDRVGVPAQAISLVADGTPNNPVIVDASTSSGPGFKLSSTKGAVLDGFEIRGAADGGVVVKSASNNLTIQNCIVHNSATGSAVDGIRVQDSASVVVFNNLVYANTGRGIAIVGTSSGSKNAMVINNTVYGHGDRGITIGTTQAASPSAFVQNNIVQNNASEPSIDANVRVYTPPPNTVPDSLLNYKGDYNLVFAPSKYIPAAAQGQNDVNLNASFVSANSGDFHLRVGSPAIDAGGLLNNLFTVDHNGQMVLMGEVLRARTTSSTGALDTGPLDLGYHYVP
jgi:hypothetical protein